MSTQTRRHLRAGAFSRPTVDERLQVAFSQPTVDERLQAAFPEISFEAIAAKSPTLNAHNLGEKWEATVRAFQWWVDLANNQ